MLNAAYDVNFLYEAIDIACGIKLNREELKRKQLNPRFKCFSFDFNPDNNLKITHININLEKLKKHRELVEFVFLGNIGDNLNIFISRLMFTIGWIVVKCNINETKESLDKSLNEVLSNFQVEYISI